MVVGTTQGSGSTSPLGGTWTPLFGLTSQGFLGVGTDTPLARLHVLGGDFMLSAGNIQVDNKAFMQARNATGTLETFLWPRWSDNIMYVNYGSGGLNIRNNNSTPAMFIRPDLTVSIGGAFDPRGAVEIRNDETRITIADRVGESYMQVGRANVTTTGGNNQGAFIGLNNSNHDRNFKWAVYNGDSNWDFASDRRLKKDIVDAEPMLERALQVQVRRFRWRDSASDSPHMLGVIAQELQQLFPGMVGEVEHPQTSEKSLTVGYGDFGVIAIKALQEMKAGHESEMKQLRSEIEELKAQLKEVLSAARQIQGGRDASRQSAAAGP